MSGRRLTAEDFETDTSGHDTACDCKACLLNEWHVEVEALRREVREAEDRGEKLARIAHDAYSLIQQGREGEARAKLAGVVFAHGGQ
jgi:queuine/archaeosine tRNA-ribosyltransferase